MAIDREFLTVALERLTAHYEQADEERRRATREMLKAQAVIKALYALATDEPMEFTGSLADACRAVLREGKPLTPLEVRKGILVLGYNLTKHKNPQASIHSVLKRLVESGDLKHVTASVTDDDGTTIDKTAYQWVQRAVRKRRRAASARRRAASTIDTSIASAVSGIGEIDFEGLGGIGEIDFEGLSGIGEIDFEGLSKAIAGFDGSWLEQVKLIDTEAQRLVGSIDNTAAAIAPYLEKLKK